MTFYARSVVDPATYRPAPGDIPTEPGVYRFKDEYGRVIYVGKAKNLRNRLSNYFQDLSALHPRTQQMVTTAAAVEWTVVPTEVAALTLEFTWIKEFDPRFNVKYRDDKSYPFLAVTMGEKFPRAQVMRGAKRPGTRYFGPYGHAWAIRETLDLLLRVFPIRTCSAGVFERAKRSGRPCLLGYIDKCSAPCVGRISEQEHKQIAEDFCAFMSGDTTRFVKRFEKEMKAAASEQNYELAAKLRDDIGALSKALEKNAVVLGDATDADIFAIVGDDLEAAVQVFHVRGGRIRGQRGWVVEKNEQITDAELVEQLLGQLYSDDPTATPKEVLVPTLPENPKQIQEWLSTLRGSKVDLRIPQRGDKKELAATVQRNAEHALTLHRTKRAGDLTTRAAALKEIQLALDLDQAPLRIECYDVSHTQGTYQSASMVVFEDGLPRKSEYRMFNIRGPEGNGAADDTAAMYEVISRRFARYLKDRDGVADLELATGEITYDFQTGGLDSATYAQNDGITYSQNDGIIGDDDAASSSGKTEDGKPKRFAYPPNLVIVDGGQPQVNAAQRALNNLGITDVKLAGLAKRLEELWLPDEEYPVILPRTSEGLYLMQRVRDEAHRFAITAHRKRRSKGMTTSALDNIPGLGPVRAKELLRHFGSLKKLKLATPEEIQTVRGMGEATATAVYGALHPGENARSFKTPTGGTEAEGSATS